MRHEPHETETEDGGIAAGLPGDVWDGLCLAGSAALVVGAGMVYLPAAVILGGGLLLAFGLWGSRVSAGRSERTDGEPEG